jgi:hypothetical protein
VRRADAPGNAPSAGFPGFLMNILFTSVDSFPSVETERWLAEWRARHQLVEQMPMDRVARYLRFEPASARALVDAIVCMADSPLIAFRGERQRPVLDFPVEKALRLAKEVRGLPEACTMRDGRKWRSIPFAVFGNLWTSEVAIWKQRESHAQIFPPGDPAAGLKAVQNLVDEYQARVLDDYRNCGILVRFVKGRAQIGPALTRKNREAESDYYYGPGDLRNNTNWVTVSRDNQGIRHDVELFEELLDRCASETEMHRFFEEHPSILMQARMGIPISHGPRFDRPKGNTPDFYFSPILGLWDKKAVELMELKGPADSTLRKGPHAGFTSKVTRAIDQVRDYGRYLRSNVGVEIIATRTSRFARRLMTLGNFPGSISIFTGIATPD